jgi:hypothetical protein
MTSEAFFNTVLSTRDAAQIQQAFERFRSLAYALRRLKHSRFAVNLNACSRGYSFQNGFNIDIVSSYSAFLCRTLGL